jgi:hypothetical protein
VPSEPPLLSPSPVPALPWWIQPTARPKTSLVNWPAIVAATAIAFAGVVSAIAWIATHPSKATHQIEPTPVLATISPPSDAVALPPAPPPFAARPTAPLVTIPAVHRPSREELLVNHIPRVEEMPPPLPPPLPAPEPKCVKLPPVAEAPSAGETYGTQVLFLNNPEVAAETAQREKKLLFVMHISGNFEDACFT